MKSINQIAKDIANAHLEGYHGPENIWGIAVLLDHENLNHPQYGDGEALFAETERVWDLMADEDGEILISETITSIIPKGMKFVTEDEMNAITTNGATTH